MLHTDLRVRQEPSAFPRVSRFSRRQTAHRGLLDVLDRASKDNRFIADLTDHGAEALAQYNLAWQEQAALLSGDIRWIEMHFGKLSAQQRTWLECRLEQEVW